MTFLKDKWVTIVLLCLLAFGAWFRASIYGNLNLSIGTRDTQSYVDSSTAPLFSQAAFIGRRLFTTNLLYKLANDGQNCKLTTVSNPTMGIEEERTFQPCFSKIVLLQNIISILGWCFLAWTTSRHLNHPLYKIIIAILILTFGFTPQIAEWDSILSSESLSLSLLPVILAILQEVVFGIVNKEKKQSGTKNEILISIWLLVFTLWVFVRDVQLYAIVVTLALLFPFLLIKKIRQIKIIPISIIILIGILILGYNTSHRSPRWQPSLMHALNAYIFPYPARVDFFTKLGMPENRSSREYAAWFSAHATQSYGAFLISHPGFVVTTIWEKIAYFRSDFEQPYYKVPANSYRENLLIAGEFVHPESMAVYLLDALLFVFLCAKALKYRDTHLYAWAWLAGWYLLCATVMLLTSFFGDTDGTRRHIFPSVEMFRLFLWIFLMPHLDLSGADRQTSTQQQSA